MRSLLTRFERTRVVSSFNRPITAYKKSTQKKKLRGLLLLVVVGAIGFWTSIGRAQNSCGEQTLHLYQEPMGDLSACNQNSQVYTWVYRHEALPYSPTDPLLATFTGGKTNVREPYYPSYETTSNSCEADRDKFSSTITITFNKPIANFRTRLAHYMNQAINYTVTANNGSMAIVSLAPYQGQPGFGTVKEVVLPGDDITSVTIRPNSFGPNGSWRFLVYHDIYVTWPPSYTNCNCNRSTFARPANQTISTSWPAAFGTDPNWNMQVNVSDQDGLVLSNVKLGQRYLVEKISVPYFYLETSAVAPTRGELKPDGAETSMRSRLVNYYVQKDPDKLVIEAQYVIDKITASSLSCLQITQRYEFYNTKPGDQCEPSGKLPCSRWKPIVKYQFFGRDGEFLKSLNIAQRQHRTVDGNPYNTVGLFKDSDTIGELLSTGLFTKKYNPLNNEWYDKVISKGKSANQWDNVHQTFARVVEEPGIDWTFQNWDPRRPGCPECFHSHWRWGSITGGEGGGNIIGIPAGSNQDLDFAVVTNQAGEEHPQNRFSDVVNGLVQYWQPIRTFNTAGRNPLQVYRHSAPEDVVFWQSGTGYQHRDTFFSHGGFFNPALATRQLYTRSSGSGLMAGSVKAKATHEVSSSEDGLSAITAELVFSLGETTPAGFDPGLAGTFPAGYQPYNNQSYDIETTAEASGPYTVTFELPSISDQTMFNNLRIFHIEQDPFDPTKIVWVDRTVLGPDPNQPDFANRRLSARVSTLGQLVVATLITPQPPITAVANIAVTTSDSPGSVVAGNNLTYTVNVTNNGPQTATGIELSSALSPQARFISVNTSQGTCTEEEGTIGCKLNQLTSTSTAVVTIVVKPTDEGSAIPPGGRIITNTVFAKAVEIDTDLSNNTATETSTILPDSNSAPTVNITSPAGGSLFAGPATIGIDLTAADADGSVSAVEVYADGEPIGSATSAGGGSYTLNWSNVDFGSHTLIATARDNQNRIGVSAPISLIVNGAATVNITSPTNLAMITTQDVVVTANASIAGATIDKVEFYADGFAFIGSGVLSGPDQYTLTWVSPSAGSHKLVAVATDSNGVTTTSGPVTFTVNDAPSVNLNSPVNGALYNAPASIPFSVTANDSDGSVQRVEFLANGQVVRTVDANLFTSQFNSTWSNVAAGEYTMTAAVTDQQGAVTTSPPVQVTVNALPTVTITSPAPGTVFNAPANTTLVANASDSDGTIAGVSFYANGILIGPGAPTGPGQYSVDWAQSMPNNYALTAIASDNRGGTRTSAAVNVNVNAPPVVSIISPANNAAFATPASVALTASASDSGGSINKVEFFANGGFIGLGTAGGNGQYSFNWTSVPAGSYTLTAVASDNTALTTTSSPINIIVNTPPAVSIVSPANGNQYSGPANVNILATATDGDGAIARVDFYANATLIGVGAPSGGNQFNFTWSSVGIGSYALTAVAIDNSGLATTSAAISISVTTPVLLVTNSTTLNTAENAVKARLEALSHTVVVKTAATAVTADAPGKALVVISSTVTPSALGTKFRTVTVPVLTWESGIYANMGMTGTTNKDFGTKTNQTQIGITNPTHALAAGLTGNTTVASATTVNWGKPNANAVAIGTVLNDTAKTVVFAYETGAVMPGLTAPARRVGFFMHDTTALNANGTAMLDAAIRWAIGGGSVTGSFATSPVGSLDLTAEGTIDWAHWGRGGPTAFDHKGAVTQRISNFTKIGTAGLSWFNDGPTLFSWTDGTPTVSATNTGSGVNTSGIVGNGFEFTLPADSNPRVLKVYGGVWFTQSKLEVSLSDGSAPSFVNTSLSNNGGASFGVYTITFKAGSPGQTLKVRYTILNQYFSPNGNVALEAATLR